MAALTSNLQLRKPASADRLWDVQVNGNSDALDGLAALGPLATRASTRDAVTGAITGLGVAVAAGTFYTNGGVPVSYAGGSLTLTASTTTYLWLTEAGVLTSGTAFPASGNYVPLSVVVAGLTNLTSITDSRAVFRAVVAVRPSGAYEAPITNSTGGTIGTTLAAVTATNSTDQSGPVNNNFATLFSQVDELRRVLVALNLMKGSV